MTSIKFLGAIALSFTLASCAVLDFDSPSNTSGGGAQMAPPLIVDGYGNPAPELQRQSPLPMMQDPEQNLEDAGLQVTATSRAEADRKCEETAASRSDSTAIVKCLGCRKRTATTDKWMCTLRTETVGGTDNAGNQ